MSATSKWLRLRVYYVILLIDAFFTNTNWNVKGLNVYSSSRLGSSAIHEPCHRPLPVQSPTCNQDVTVTWTLTIFKLYIKKWIPLCEIFNTQTLMYFIILIFLPLSIIFERKIFNCKLLHKILQLKFTLRSRICKLHNEIITDFLIQQYPRNHKFM